MHFSQYAFINIIVVFKLKLAYDISQHKQNIFKIAFVFFWLENALDQ